MKELSIEEKAKRYDGAIELVNSKWHYKNKPCIIDVSEIFPELKESEDEKIVNALIGYIEGSVHDVNEEIIPGIKISDAIDWLENQGEQKPAWSEEDEKQARQIERIVHDDGCSQKLQKQIADWFKSLRPQNTWKPSKEQIVALRWVLNNVPYNKHKEEISGLLDQIKDL